MRMRILSIAFFLLAEAPSFSYSLRALSRRCKLPARLQIPCSFEFASDSVVRFLRDAAHLSFGALGWTSLRPNAIADTRMEADEDGKYLEEILSKEGAKMYKQYWPALQLAADYYAFELDPLIQEPAKWAKFEDLFRESGARGGQGQPSQLERTFINPMRILTASFPEPDDLQQALQLFSKDMRSLQKLTLGFSAGDVPSVKIQKEVSAVFGQGRSHLNEFFLAMNDATGTQRMVTIPDPVSTYPRSKSRYVELKRNLAKCQNRGGEALASIWGQLMVYSTAGVSPCGDLNLANYFDQ